MGKDNQKDKYKDAEKFINHYIEFISDGEDQADEELDKILTEKGVDISGLINNVQQMVDDVIESDRLSWQQEAEEARESSLQAFKEKAKKLVFLSKTELIQTLKDIAKIEDSDFSYAHRNLKLEDISEEELREIINEYFLLKGKD